MIKKLINASIGLIGLKIVRLEKTKRFPSRSASQDLLARFAPQFSQNPLDPDLHLRLAKAAWKEKRYFLANSELKTAEFLGLDRKASDDLKNELKEFTPDILCKDHNWYYRLWSLSNSIKQLSDGRRLSILDVGGGDGGLAHFLPDCDYCLAEPTTNGIFGECLPFENEAFDYVVACHVLEHIEPENRQQFLEQLLSKSRNGLILLNPFNIEGASEKERLELLIDITGAEWAKEHLECSLPDIESIETFAEHLSLDLTVQPNGTLASSLALVFMSHFASLSGQQLALEKVNHFLNTRFINLMDSESCPTAYLVLFKKTSPDMGHIN